MLTCIWSYSVVNVHVLTGFELRISAPLLNSRKSINWLFQCFEIIWIPFFTQSVSYYILYFWAFAFVFFWFSGTQSIGNKVNSDFFLISMKNLQHKAEYEDFCKYENGTGLESPSDFQTGNGGLERLIASKSKWGRALTGKLAGKMGKMYRCSQNISTLFWGVLRCSTPVFFRHICW